MLPLEWALIWELKHSNEWNFNTGQKDIYFIIVSFLRREETFPQDKSSADVKAQLRKANPFPSNLHMLKPTVFYTWKQANPMSVAVLNAVSIRGGCKLQTHSCKVCRQWALIGMTCHIWFHVKHGGTCLVSQLSEG